MPIFYSPTAGNSVTPEWWDSIWISEGFSSYYEMVAFQLVSRFHLYFINYVHTIPKYVCISITWTELFYGELYCDQNSEADTIRCIYNLS